MLPEEVEVLTTGGWRQLSGVNPNTCLIQFKDWELTRVAGVRSVTEDYDGPLVGFLGVGARRGLFAHANTPIAWVGRESHNKRLGGFNWTTLAEFLADPPRHAELPARGHLATGLRWDIDKQIRLQVAYSVAGSGDVVIARTPEETSRLRALFEAPGVSLGDTTVFGLNEPMQSGWGWIDYSIGSYLYYHGVLNEILSWYRPAPYQAVRYEVPEEAIPALQALGVLAGVRLTSPYNEASVTLERAASGYRLQNLIAQNYNYRGKLVGLNSPESFFYKQEKTILIAGGMRD